MTWPRLWLGVRGVLCVAQFSWMSLATNERNKTGRWYWWGENNQRKKGIYLDMCVPRIVLIFSFAIFNAFFFFVSVAAGVANEIIGAILRVLYCAVRDLGHPLLFFLFQKRNTMERLEMRNWRSSSRASEREANIHIIFFFLFFYFSICVSSSLLYT